MIWLIVGVIISLILMAVIACYQYENNDKVDFKVLIGLVGLLIAFPSLIGNVKTGEVGIKTTWGKITSTNLKEGVQLKTPWQKIEKMNIKVQKYENETAMETSTKDMQIVNSIIVSVNYQLDEDKAVDMYRAVGTNYDSVILEPSIQESIKGAISQYNAEELVTNRNAVSEAISMQLSEKVEDYGLKILNVSLKNFDFSAEYNKAIEQKTVAEQNTQTAKQNAERQKVEAEAKLEVAKTEAERKKVEAEAEAEANRIKEKTITDEILMQEYIEKWNGELPKIVGSDGNIFDVSSMFK